MPQLKLGGVLVCISISRIRMSPCHFYNSLYCWQKQSYCSEWFVRTMSVTGNKKKSWAVVVILEKKSGTKRNRFLSWYILWCWRGFCWSLGISLLRSSSVVWFKGCDILSNTVSNSSLPVEVLWSINFLVVVGFLLLEPCLVSDVCVSCGNTPEGLLLCSHLRLYWIISVTMKT